MKKSYHSQQISGIDEANKNVLAIIAKRSYRIDPRGICIPDIETVPIIEDLVFYSDTEDEEEQLEHDIDLYPVKPYTDVVIKGFAQTIGQSREFPVEFQIGHQVNSFLAIGNRNAFMGSNGKVTFSKPELIDRIPLRYKYAYGGRDKVSEANSAKYSQEVTKAIPDDINWKMGSEYAYPRNLVGKGYLVHKTKDGIEQLELPNFEDLKERLNPETIASGNPKAWTRMPIPRCTDWVDPWFFPRRMYYGISPLRANPTNNITEISRGWANPNIMNNIRPKKKFSFRCMNGASLGLQFPFLKGNEECRLINIYPNRPDFRFRLPADIPELWVDGRNGKLKETTSVLQTIIIEPEEDRLSVVWRGNAPAKREYLETELKEMPFKVAW